MAHKILMLGGKRAGKSTVLSCILHALHNMPGDLLTFTDMTDYTRPIKDKDGNDIPRPTLRIKKNEVQKYVEDQRKNMGANSRFIVDMTPNYSSFTYTLHSTLGENATADFDFVDVPGEWMRENVPEHAQLIQMIKESDVFIIAVDTPYLMEAQQEVNDVYNRISEITASLINNIRCSDIIDEKSDDRWYDSKLIIFAPIKCEKWLLPDGNNRGMEIFDKIKSEYRLLINSWVRNPHVEMWCMPVITAGGIESAGLLPAKLVFTNNEDRVGIECSEDSLTSLVYLKNGESLQSSEVIRIEDDGKCKIDFTIVPRSWFKINGKGFTPQYCEQPAYHIVRFLVDKERKLAVFKENHQTWWEKIKGMFGWVSVFGRNLPIYEQFVHELKQQRLLKETGDGYSKIEDIVP